MPRKKARAKRIKISDYRTRARYNYYKNLREYNKYSKAYDKSIARMKKHNVTPYNASVNLGKLDMQNYLANKKFYKDLGAKNPMQKVLNDQLYKFTYEQSVKLHQGIMSNDELREQYGSLSLDEIRTGNKFSLDYLKDYWKAMKEYNKTLPKEEQKTLKALADEMEMDWFGYTQ